MRLRLAVRAAALVAAPAAAAPEVPRFPKNSRYESVRESLVAAGWQPAPSGTRACSSRPDICDEDRPEILSCAETALKQCTAAWRRGETMIHVLIWGDRPPLIERIECREGCK